MEKRLHLKGLNGLRAIAAISVVIAHIHLDGFVYNDRWPRWLGTYSVTIFFTLSGFLITYLLLNEKQRTVISIAWLSHKFFEKPFLWLKDRFSVLKVPGNFIRSSRSLAGMHWS